MKVYVLGWHQSINHMKTLFFLKKYCQGATLCDILGVERPSFFMKIVAYTTPGCFYCDQLKELFKRAEVEYEAIVVESDEERQKFRKDFPRAGGYPYVLVDDKHVGGLVETAKLFLEKGLVSSSKK